MAKGKGYLARHQSKEGYRSSMSEPHKKSCSLDKTWKSGTGNVRESRLNAGGDQKWRGSRGKGMPKSMSYS